jgi:glutaredoxin
VKELLSNNGIEFEDRDIADPEAREELRQLGYATVPTTAIGERVLRGFQPRELSQALGLEPKQVEALGSEAVEIFDRLLAAVIRATRQIPDERLGEKLPARQDWVTREFAYHIPRWLELVLEALPTGKFDDKPFLNFGPESEKFQSVDEIARYGEQVRARLKACFHSCTPEQLDSTIEAFSGPTTFSGLLRQAEEHTAHHLKQLYASLSAFGVEPREPFSEEDFEKVKPQQ